MVSETHELESIYYVTTIEFIPWLFLCKQVLSVFIDA